MLYKRKNLFKDVEVISIYSHYVGQFFPRTNLVQFDELNAYERNNIWTFQCHTCTGAGKWAQRVKNAFELISWRHQKNCNMHTFLVWNWIYNFITRWSWTLICIILKKNLSHSKSWLLHIMWLRCHLVTF